MGEKVGWTSDLARRYPASGCSFCIPGAPTWSATAASNRCRLRRGRRPPIGVCGTYSGPGSMAWFVAMLSPFGPFHLAADSTYVITPYLFWLSLGLAHALGWLLLESSATHVERTWDVPERHELPHAQAKPASEEPVRGVRVPGEHQVAHGLRGVAAARARALAASTARSRVGAPVTSESTSRRAARQLCPKVFRP